MVAVVAETVFVELSEDVLDSLWTVVVSSDIVEVASGEVFDVNSEGDVDELSSEVIVSSVVDDEVPSSEVWDASVDVVAEVVVFVVEEDSTDV